MIMKQFEFLDCRVMKHFYSLLFSFFLLSAAQAQQQRLSWASGRPDEYRAAYWQTQALSFAGEWRKSDEQLSRATELALRAEAKEVVASYTADQAVRAAWLGLFAEAVTLGDAALKIEHNRSVLTSSALAFALAGEVSKAKLLIPELEEKYPKDTRVNQLWLPEIKAALELHKGNAQTVLELLEPTQRYEAAGGFWPQTLRSMAYLKLGQGGMAAAEARKILNHRGEGPLSLLWPLAHLSLARASVLQNDSAQARKSYQDFFALWNNADVDLPILIEAKKEYARLK